MRTSRMIVPIRLIGQTDSERGLFVICSPGPPEQFSFIAASPSISQEPSSLYSSEWADLLSQLPLFPPAAQPPPAL